MRSEKNSFRSQEGFTLVEIAVVIAIGALLLGFGLSVLTAQLTNTRIKSSQNQANVIKKALITFVATNNRLPCPAVENLPDSDANYGVEARDPATDTCAFPGGVPSTTNLTDANYGDASRGIVPWVSLGIADSAALDGWNRRFTYVVRTDQAFLVGWNVQNPGEGTVPGMRGNVTVHNATPIGRGLPDGGGQNQINACTATPLNTLVDNSCNNFAVALIISHGVNGSGAFLPGTGARSLPLPAGANELENTDTDTAFTQMAFTDNAASPGGVFDDLVLWLPPSDFTMPLQANGAIPSAQGLLTERLARIENAILGFSIVDRVDPDGPPIPAGPPQCTCGADCVGPADTVPSGWAGCRTAFHRVPLADAPPWDGVADALPLPQTIGGVPWQTLGLTVQDVLDPWGIRLDYQTFHNITASILAPRPVYERGINSLWVPDANAYQLSSFGPEGIPDANPPCPPTCDDVVVVKPTSELIAEMARAGIPVF